MIAWRNYRGILAVGVCLAASLVVIDLVLPLLARPFTSWLARQQAPMGWNHLEDADRIVAGLVRQYRRGDVAPDAPLGIYVGLSTGRAGIDPNILHEDDCHETRYVGFCGFGKSLEHLLLLCGPLFRSPFKPMTAILCVHEGWLVGSPAAEPAAHVNPLSALSRHDWRQAAKAVRDWPWIIAYRTDINYTIRRVVYEARASLFDCLHLAADVFSPPDPDPWLPPKTDIRPDVNRADDGFLGEQLRGWYRWFEPQEYETHEQAQIAWLVQLIGRFRERGARVFVLVMPEHTVPRRRIPPSAYSFLRAALAKEFDGAPPVVLLDFRAVLPDSMFYDYVHVNQAGRAELSHRLAQAMRRKSEKVAKTKRIV
jgi:hypothetical protein